MSADATALSADSERLIAEYVKAEVDAALGRGHYSRTERTHDALRAHVRQLEKRAAETKILSEIAFMLGEYLHRQHLPATQDEAWPFSWDDVDMLRQIYDAGWSGSRRVPERLRAISDFISRRLPPREAR